MISTIMHPLPIIIAKYIDSIFTIATLMKQNQVSSIIINDENDIPVGIITERDMVRKLIACRKDSNTTKAVEIISRPLITADANTSLLKAVKIMEKNKIRRLPVVKENLLVGFLTITDIIKHFNSLYKEEQYLFRFMLRYKMYLEE